MRKSVKNLIATGLVAAATASAPMVFAAASSNTQNSGQTGQMMQGMMGMMGMASTGMTNGGMMNSRNTMPMMQGWMNHGPGGPSK